MSRKVNYHQSTYWEQRYKQNICEWYEWLCTPNQFTPQIQSLLIDKNLKILELGCGTSNLSDKLISMGQQDITCLDYSKQVIRNRQKGAKQGIKYKYHNILQKLPFEDEQFDLIIEKNTIDCLFCIDNYPVHVLKCMKECYRVLKQGGNMVSVTHGKPNNRYCFYRNRFAPFNLKYQHLINNKNNQVPITIFTLTKGEPNEINNQIDEGQNAIDDHEQNKQENIDQQNQNKQNSENEQGNTSQKQDKDNSINKQGQQQDVKSQDQKMDESKSQQNGENEQQGNEYGQNQFKN